MLATERHRRILAELGRARSLTTEELVTLLGVSAETVRRDLALLERRGELARVHGGATAAASPVGEEAPFVERSRTHAGAKTAIGRAAAALVEPRQTVIIDVGTTALEVARALPHDHTGLIATPSLLVAAELSVRPGVEVLVSGGHLRPGDLVCSNAQTVAFFADLRADVAFVGSGGVDVQSGLTDYYLDEVATKRMILANSVRSYVLADASKHGRAAAHRVCGLDGFDGLIADGTPDRELVRALEQAGGSVIGT